MSDHSAKQITCLMLALGLATNGLSLLAAEPSPKPVDLTRLSRQPDEPKLAQVGKSQAVLSHDRWAFLLAGQEYADVAVHLTCTLRQPARRFDYFGQFWSVWPDPAFTDLGYEAAVLLRAGPGSGYRVQWSHKYQDVALVKYPDGGYLQVVPCPVKLGQPQQVAVRVQGNQIVVRVDGQERIRYQDDLLPLTKGKAGIGVSSDATVAFEGLTITELPAKPPVTRKGPHEPNFAVRPWLGGRPWVFDGHQPILLLMTAEAPFFNCARLRPGYKPQLSWNAFWDIANQGAFKEGESKSSDATVSGGGKSLDVSWAGRHVKDRFVTRSKLTVGYDPKRNVYTYAVASELEVLPGEPFHFRYGYDFEHHTPLDPFRWQYLVVRREGGILNHRPLYPVDPGRMGPLQQDRGLRLWYGRHREKMLLAPAVEYDLPASLNADPDQPGVVRRRELDTGVCQAFYDTGVVFAPETAKAGTRVKVRYRYTGYEAAEAEAVFRASTVYPSRMFDPGHHYLFADEWPRLTFRQFEPLSRAWLYGRTPFMAGHNQRPTYELAKGTGVGSGFAMKLGPGAYGKARLPAPAPLLPGRYLVTAQCKSDNAHGPGGRIEVAVLPEKGEQPLAAWTHHVGNGTFAWKTVGFVFEVPERAGGLTVAFGNGGTGEVLFAEVEFQRLEAGAAPPKGLRARANPQPPLSAPAPAGAIADYRMQEGRGEQVYDYAQGPFGMLGLANVGWVTDEGRPALQFTDAAPGSNPSRAAEAIERNYLSHPAYKGRERVPVAIAGYHGGSLELRAFTVTAFVKPAARMGKGEHGDKGDLIGLGARRFVLRLQGHQAPYRLAAALDVQDQFLAEATLEADRWYHVAMTGEPTSAKQWRIRLYLDGKLVHEGESRKCAAPARLPPSLILGAELFYLHDAYYRGLIGRTTVFDRSLRAEQIAELADRSRR